MGIEPKVVTESEPISEVTKVTTITNPVGQKNVAGTQVNPATEDTLASVKTAVEIIDNFISSTRGLVTEDSGVAIKTAVEAVHTALQSAGITQVQLDAIKTATEATNTALQTAGITQVQLAAIKTAVELIDNFISGSRGLVTEDNSGSILAQLNITLSALRDALRGTGTKDFTTLETDIESILARLDVALSTRATETTLAKLMPTTVIKYAVAMTSADTQYSQALTDVKKFRIHTRDFTEFRLAFVTGKVATPTDPYETVPAGSEKYEDNLNIANLTLYFASGVAGKTAEIEVWS